MTSSQAEPGEGSIFAGINWDEGSDNPFGLGPGVYETTISDAVKERSRSNNLGLWLTFSADNGKSIRKWVTMPEEGQDPETYSRNTSFLRLLLRNLEIPETEWDTLTTNSFRELDCVITVTAQKKNPEYNQVSKIARSKGSGHQSYPSIDLDFSKLADSTPEGTFTGF